MDKLTQQEESALEKFRRAISEIHSFAKAEKMEVDSGTDLLLNAKYTNWILSKVIEELQKALQESATDQC